MREYEMIYVLKPDASEEIVERLHSKISRVFEEQGGVVFEREVWGKKKLAYEIDRNSRGQFFQLQYAGGGSLNAELTRVFRLDDCVLRYLPVKVADDVDIETRKAKVKEPRVNKPSDDGDDDDQD